MKFRDRVQAGNILAERLSASPTLISRDRSQSIVLGIPRGGVIIADIVARKLSTDFDVAMGRKLGAPENPELAIGAIMEDGTTYLNEYLIKALKLSDDYLEREKSKQLAVIKYRTAIYPKSREYILKDKIVILTDDGIATGATIIAAARWIKKHGPNYLIIAVPVALPQTVEILRQEADAIDVILSPEALNSVGQFYENFEPITDDKVSKILTSAAHF
ncbi:MAG TPA: phosphoribosyltransferase family protein [Candidatus Nitrosopolaris sp.]|nr:phosphoribosyltransferase family protein [Candidatus Nitrosopolaris sp.]